MNNEPVENWHDWMETLKGAIDLGEKVGLTNHTMANLGSKLGTFLSHNIDPDNKEERLLKEMWNVANEKERENMTNVLIKMLKLN